MEVINWPLAVSSFLIFLCRDYGLSTLPSWAALKRKHKQSFTQVIVVLAACTDKCHAFLICVYTFLLDKKMNRYRSSCATSWIGITSTSETRELRSLEAEALQCRSASSNLSSLWLEKGKFIQSLRKKKNEHYCQWYVNKFAVSIKILLKESKIACLYSQ